jgi:hypothetical protein
MLPQIAVVSPPQVKKRTEIRRGLLYMFLAAVIYYFAGGYSAMNLPFPIDPLVTVYLSPLLFVSGLLPHSVNWTSQDFTGLGQRAVRAK